MVFIDFSLSGSTHILHNAYQFHGIAEPITSLRDNNFIIWTATTIIIMTIHLKSSMHLTFQVHSLSTAERCVDDLRYLDTTNF